MPFGMTGNGRPTRSSPSGGPALPPPGGAHRTSCPSGWSPARRRPAGGQSFPREFRPLGEHGGYREGTLIGAPDEGLEAFTRLPVCRRDLRQAGDFTASIRLRNGYGDRNRSIGSAGPLGRDFPPWESGRSSPDVPRSDG